MNGAVVSCAVSENGHVIKDFKELTRTELATKSPHPLRFEEADRGKTVYIVMQWQNESGERGDPTEIQSAFRGPAGFKTAGKISALRLLEIWCMIIPWLRNALPFWI
jgi:hypothetical protein